MNKYGIIRYPQGNGQRFAYGGMLGTTCFEHKPEDLKPAVCFWNRADDRDVMLQVMARDNPGVIFCPVDLDSALSFPASEKPVSYSISKNGDVLPIK